MKLVQIEGSTRVGCAGRRGSTGAGLSPRHGRAADAVEPKSTFFASQRASHFANGVVVACEQKLHAVAPTL